MLVLSSSVPGKRESASKQNPMEVGKLQEGVLNPMHDKNPRRHEPAGRGGRRQTGLTFDTTGAQKAMTKR